MTKQYEFEQAVIRGNAETVRLLLKDDGINPDSPDNDAIFIACECGHEEITKILLEDGRVDPAAEDNFAILIARENGYTNIVKLLEQAIKERSND